VAIAFDMFLNLFLLEFLLMWVIKTIVSDLVKLGKIALKMFDEYVAEKNIQPPMRVYIRHYVTDLEISETSCGSRGSSEIIQKPDWTKIIFDFMEEKVKTLPEFKQLVQFIAKRYKKNINELAKGCNEASQTAFWLRTFIQRLIYEKLEDKLSEESIIEYASLFKSELELSPTEYKFVCYLQGIFLEPESIKINDHLLIRKPQKEDLEYVRDIFFDIPRPQYMYVPSSILEVEMFAKDEKECYEYVNRILNSLRLFKLGSIHSKETIISKRTAIWPMGSSRSWGHRNYSTFSKYTVKETQVETFINFINTIEQKLSFDNEKREYRTLYISIDRYNAALLEPVDIERKLMTAVMGLESLFTLEKERGENAFKLGIRVAKLLSFIGFDAIKVRELTEEAYSYRNKVVHGSYISRDKKRRISEILFDILNYLRVSLIIFLLNQNIGKNKMVDMIDKSMISSNYQERLKALLERSIEEFMEVLK